MHTKKLRPIIVRQEERALEFGRYDFLDSDSDWDIIKISKALPIYSKWISLLVSASPSSNSIISEKKKTVIKMRENLYIVKESMLGYLGEGTNALNMADSEQKKIIMRETLEKISREVQKFALDNSTNPFRSVLKFPDKDTLSFLYTGNIGPKYISPFETAYQYIERVMGSVKIPHADLAKSRLRELIAKAINYVELQFKIVGETDSKLVLAEGNIGHASDVSIMSPVKMLRATSKYLNSVIYNYGDSIPPHMEYLIQETKEFVNIGISEFDRPLDLDNVYDSHAKVARIQHILAPEIKVNFINDRLIKIINFDVREKLKTGFFSSRIDSLLKLSTYDGLTTLQKHVGLDLNMMQMDARGAMKSSFENLSALSDIFDYRIYKILKRLNKKIKKYQRVKSFSDTRNMLCSAILAAPKLSWRYSKKIMRYCSDSNLKSVYSGMQLELKYSKLANKDFEDRVCKYDTYLIKNSNYQKLRFEQ